MPVRTIAGQNGDAVWSAWGHGDVWPSIAAQELKRVGPGLGNSVAARLAGIVDGRPAGPA